MLCAGCETLKIAATAEPFCEAVKHVCVSRDDKLTEKTSRQLLANNLGRKPLCPPPKDPCAELREPAAKPAAKPVASLGVDGAAGLPRLADVPPLFDGWTPPSLPEVDEDRARRVG